MPRINHEEIERELEEQKAAWIARKAELMNDDLLDDDGYPTDAALELVQSWHWTDTRGLLEFIKNIWHLASWGWREVDAKDLPADHSDHDEDGGTRYFISTAGWSGNESIIRAFQQNGMAWHLCWIQSRRGGHYILKAHEFASEQ